MRLQSSNDYISYGTFPVQNLSGLTKKYSAPKRNINVQTLYKGNKMLNNKDFCAKIADIARIISTRMIHCPPQESHIRRIGVVETPIAGQHRHFRPPSWRQSPSLETVRVSVRSQTVAAASRHVISGMPVGLISVTSCDFSVRP